MDSVTNRTRRAVTGDCLLRNDSLDFKPSIKKQRTGPDPGCCARVSGVLEAARPR